MEVFMVANAIAVAFIAAWIFAAVHLIMKDQKKARDSGVPVGCCGCAAYKSGKCAHCKSPR